MERKLQKPKRNTYHPSQQKLRIQIRFIHIIYQSNVVTHVGDFNFLKENLKITSLLHDQLIFENPHQVILIALLLVFNQK